MRQLNENQIFQYNGSPITFQKGDSVMVNATEMAKPFGKLVGDWLRLKTTTEFTEALSADMQIPISALIQVVKGGNNEQGTWMHEDVALEFARWLSPSFAIWCNKRIKELLQYGMTATQPTLEQIINNPDLVISLATQLKNEREEKERLEQDKKQLEEKTAKQEPYVSFAKVAFKAEGKVDIGQAAKILNLGFGRNTLFKKLKEAGVFFNDRNEPKQKYIDAGYFQMTLLPPIHRNNHPDILCQKVYCNPKGLAFINHLFGGNPSKVKKAKIK
ncbi:KilA-N domain-containing protein [Bacteroides clarus]|uniref:KilA-N domain-containing protein n=1 Tax=Bacteroides clarus TaxID=626929 RepID=UPI002674D63E|nr:KilA-N domain-containing protein [Bacteroides clarus]